MSAQNPVRRPPASAALPDLTRMTRAELIQLTVELGRDSDAIKRQLSNARTKARVEGVFASRPWYASAESALRDKGRQLASVYARLGVLREQARLGRNDNAFFHAFFDVAEETLSETLFEEIRRAASERAKRERP